MMHHQPTLHVNNYHHELSKLLPIVKLTIINVVQIA